RRGRQRRPATAVERIGSSLKPSSFYGEAANGDLRPRAMIAFGRFRSWLLRRGRQRRPATGARGRRQPRSHASTERPPTATCDSPGGCSGRLSIPCFYGEAANGDLRPEMLRQGPGAEQASTERPPTATCDAGPGWGAERVGEASTERPPTATCDDPDLGALPAEQEASTERPPTATCDPRAWRGSWT